jgi:hypothetical protein
MYDIPGKVDLDEAVLLKAVKIRLITNMYNPSLSIPLHNYVISVTVHGEFTEETSAQPGP